MKNKALVLALLFLVISVLNGSQATSVDFESDHSISIDDSQSITAEYVPRDIRVAIYNETNFTAPAYATTPGGVNNNVTGLMDILV